MTDDAQTTRPTTLKIVGVAIGALGLGSGLITAGLGLLTPVFLVPFGLGILLIALDWLVGAH